MLRSSTRGLVIIGAAARIVDTRIGPFTSVAAGVIIERSTVDHSVLMEEAHVIDIQRLEDSLVGRRVRSEARRHGSLSLLVGDDCLVEVPHGH